MFFSVKAMSQILDDFSDGNFTSNPTWAGTTTKWTISANSTVSIGATGSNTLRLNADSETLDYLSVQNTFLWGSQQTWAFWLGRRAQAATSTNRTFVWLYSSESDVTSATMDGYRISFGDNSGADEIVLERVDNGTATVILTSTGGTTNGITDFGFQVRVTRSISGVWNVYTSTLPTINGSGATASDPLTTITTNIFQGSTNDNTYSSFNGGYIVLAAQHTSGVDAITGYEFDNLKFESNENSTLPIQLSSFTAQAIDKTILLNWETLSETNNSGFEIERSIDGKSFIKIGSKEGSGTTTTLTKYRFVDENPLPGTNYYRLKQIDFDGKSEISAIKSAISNIPFATLSVLQSASAVTAQVISPVKEKAKLSLFDISGKVLAQQDVFLERGLNQFDFSQNLVSGIYFFKLTSASNQVNTKFVKP